MEVHQYLGWRLQAEAETGNTQGSISDDRLRILLKNYLEHEEKDASLVNDLFAALVERVVAIVSRVQGTYEFEVQPLREYFAARFLYDTAHHSSPGNEREGDKTDRFDALARNFYWLNVTRFFAGCFSKGELLSLVERLQALASEEGFRHTDHPRKLSSMLLADWVFAQHPRSMKAVVDIVLQDVATRADADRPNDVVMLPPRSGQEEVAERCWELWKSDIGSDRSHVVAQTLNANSNATSVDRRWMKEIAKKRGRSRTMWLTRGLWTGSVSRAKSDEIAAIARDDSVGLEDDSRFSVLLRSGHASIYENDPSLVKFSISSILDRHAGLIRLDRPPRTMLEGLSQAADFLRRPKEARRRRALHLDRLPARGNLVLSDSLSEVWDFIRTVNEQTESGFRVWHNSLQPWNEVVENMRGFWGDSLVAVETAVAAAGIRNANERGSVGDGLFDRGHPLVERARYARLRAGSGDWWTKQLQSAPSMLDQIFLVSLFLAWGGKRTLQTGLGEFNNWMAQTTVENRALVHRAVGNALAWAGPAAGSPTQRIDLHDLPTGLHPTTLLVLAQRTGTSLADDALVCDLYTNYFVNRVDDLDPIPCFYAARGALSLAIHDARKWPDVLQTAKKAYVSGVQVGRHLRHETQREEIPPSFAREVVEDWNSYPLAIVTLAEESCRRQVGREIETLQSTAKKQNWEWI